MRKWPIALLVLLLTLACNFPGFPEFGSPTDVPEGEASAEAPSTPEPTTGTSPEPGEEASPLPQETPTTGEAIERPTDTPTLTPTPTPTSTPTPSPAQPGPPLVFLDPAWELVSWERIPNTNDWQGILRLHISGGRAPYCSQLENNAIVNGLDVPARWRLCAPMPATVRVWSNDQQFAETKIYVWEVGCGN